MIHRTKTLPERIADVEMLAKIQRDRANAARGRGNIGPAWIRIYEQEAKMTEDLLATLKAEKHG